MNKENLKDRWIGGNEQNSNNQKNSQNLETIIEIGATPVIVDIDDSFNMDPLELEKAITEKTKLN